MAAGWGGCVMGWLYSWEAMQWDGCGMEWLRDGMVVRWGGGALGYLQDRCGYGAEWLWDEMAM